MRTTKVAVTVQGSKLVQAGRILCVLTAVTLFSMVFGPAPLRAQDSPGITSPATGAEISGDVALFGTAVIEPFQKYELHYKLEPNGDDAYVYFQGNTSPVISGQLGTWQAAGLPPGVYSLRLRVVKNDGNYAEYFARNLSVNQTAQPTPTPEGTPTPSEPTPTPIPTATFTPAPQPTANVGAVTQPQLESEAPTATPEQVAVAEVPAAPAENVAGAEAVAVEAPGGAAAVVEESGGSLSRELGEALSLQRMRNQFLNGMRYSAALFLGIVSLFGGKRFFDWIWRRFT